MTISRYITKNTLGLRPNVKSLALPHWIAVTLAVSTGGIHLYLYSVQEYLPFLLAGVGFFTMAGLLLTTFDRRLLYLGGIPFTASQIVIWYQMGMPDMQIAIIDKPAQIVLSGLFAYLLVIEWRTAERQGVTEGDTASFSDD